MVGIRQLVQGLRLQRFLHSQVQQLSQQGGQKLQLLIQIRQRLQIQTLQHLQIQILKTRNILFLQHEVVFQAVLARITRLIIQELTATPSLKLVAHQQFIQTKVEHKLLLLEMVENLLLRQIAQVSFQIWLILNG